ncbi:hypothetical protein AAMO2058_000341300 [Amorphochlora amoebiformis]|mmetsp:Transcript_29528/g.47124  ORF Transcript_29528/g.47124 Transcript_29528/m.47124 type:complete len:165 (-) Transcript_29528:186-680(-)
MSSEAKEKRKVHKTVLKTSRSAMKGNHMIEIDEGTTMHPEATILANKGPIKIGKFNLLEEKSVIVNDTPNPMVIGDFNAFEVGSCVRASSVGSRNVFEVKSVVEAGAEIGSGCVVGAGVTICKGDLLDDNVIVYGKHQNRRQIKRNRNIQDVKASIKAVSKILF